MRENKIWSIVRMGPLVVLLLIHFYHSILYAMLLIAPSNGHSALGAPRSTTFPVESFLEIRIPFLPQFSHASRTAARSICSVSDVATLGLPCDDCPASHERS